MNIHHAAKCSLAVWCLVLASALPVIAEEPASCPKPGLAPDPITRTHTPVPYPVNSQRHEQGIAILSVRIGKDGVPNDVAIAKSSASPILNNAAIEHIKTHWRWQPPMPDCPFTVQTIVMVIWNPTGAVPFDADFHLKMPASAYPPGAEKNPEMYRSTLLSIDTDEQGALTAGRVIESSGFPDLDDQALAIVMSSPALMKGQTAGKHLLAADWGNPPPGMLPKIPETVLVIGP